MQWEVHLLGDPSDLEMIVQSFSNSDWTISRHDAEFILTSERFETEIDVDQDQVRSSARHFLELLNGAAHVLLDSWRCITVGHILHRPKTGNACVIVEAGCAIAKSRALWPSVIIHESTGNVEAFHPADNVQKWTELSMNSEAIAQALRLASSGDFGWVNLYRIFEVIKKDCGGEVPLVTKGWATKEEIVLFRHTANSPGALGKEARHGGEGSLPPKHPMKLHEAQSLVLRIIRCWII